MRQITGLNIFTTAVFVQYINAEKEFKSVKLYERLKNNKREKAY